MIVTGDRNMIAEILAAVLPLCEAQAIVKIAWDYGLTPEEIVLLAAIRKTENGGDGLEFGVGQDCPGHKARRFAGKGSRAENAESAEHGKPSPLPSPLKGEGATNMESFECQARWAAGTIARRYDGNMDRFAKRYCPKNPDNWKRMVSQWMWKINVLCEVEKKRGMRKVETKKGE
jgi:hypothetical protein